MAGETEGLDATPRGELEVLEGRRRRRFDAATIVTAIGVLFVFAGGALLHFAWALVATGALLVALATVPRMIVLSRRVSSSSRTPTGGKGALGGSAR